MKYLLDTNILVDILRGESIPLRKHITDAGIDNCYVCEISWYELYYGANSSRDWQKNIEAVDTLAQQFTTIQISDAIKEAARQKCLLAQRGKMIEDFDILIGITAGINDMTLVSDNLKHMERLQGVRIEDWLR